MRMKRRNEKGEIFRKSLCCGPSCDSEEEEVLGGDSENHKTAKQGKSGGGNSENEMPKRSKKESRKKQMTTVHHTKRSGTKSSSNNQTHYRSKEEHCNKDDSMHIEHCSRKQQQNDLRTSIISNNRITRSLGIYNKAKRSDTILRENLKQKLCKKKFEDIKTKTARDMARVLDCSSFKIQLSSCSAGLPNVYDSPVDQNSGHVDYQGQSPVVSSKSHSSCSSTGRCSNPDKQKATPLLQRTPQRITPQNEAVLAFKTPLQEISQILIESLRPLETFHGRNYLAEKQEQLRKMYKQSSANSHVQKMSSNAGVASEVQKRCLKRKCFEENAGVIRTTDGGMKTQTVEPHSANSYFFGSELQSTSTTPGPQRVANENVIQQSRLALSATSKELNTNRRISQSNINFEFQDKCSSEVNNRERKLGTIREHDSSCRRCLFGQECAYFPQRDEPSLPTSHNSSSFDILDFLDGVSQGSNIKKSHGHKDYMTPDPRLVSPPKKPTLDSLTPEKKFYPHKLY